MSEIEMQDINDDGSLKENESLDEKIYTFNHYFDRNDFSFVKVKDVKEKIQNAQRRLERKINLLQKDKLNRIDYTTSRRREFNNCLKKIKEELNKIFLEEFGEKLI